MRGLNGKAAVVTGGTRGIGYACAKRLLEEGVSVLITGRNPERGENAALELAKINPNVRFLAGDMADEAFCKKVITTAIEAFGRLDYLVYNAFPFTAKALEATREDWLHTMEAGPIAYAAMIQQFVQQRGMEKGAIVNMSSISAHIAQPARWTYNAAKGAVSQLTRCAAIDLAPHIRVNAVCPGWVWTEEVAKATNGEGRERWEPIWGDFHMVMRLQEPEEIAAAMALENIGDISGIVRVGDGVCILQYAGEVPAGEVPLDDVREALTESALENVRYAAYELQLNEWLKEANAVYYPERMQ